MRLGTVRRSRLACAWSELTPAHQLSKPDSLRQTFTLHRRKHGFIVFAVGHWMAQTDFCNAPQFLLPGTRELAVQCAAIGAEFWDNHMPVSFISLTALA
ncbi:hypothetical protein [Gluconobacter oxydans]|uniref:hypothetical protein n=1 Tax=Gluconobacter oxydans TaxID=442 RepID=UPI001D036168|nr:hypothetical protein [Gluconobacter oxydans]